jgi:hypothetical protein
VCFVAIDALPGTEISPESFWKAHGTRIDASLQFHNRTSRSFNVELTFENAFGLYVETRLTKRTDNQYINFRTKSSRPGITDEAARLLTERSVRLDIGLSPIFTFHQVDFLFYR